MILSDKMSSLKSHIHNCPVGWCMEDKGFIRKENHMTIAIQDSETKSAARRKAHLMLVAAYRMFEGVDELEKNIPVCAEITLEFIKYAEESLLSSQLDDWDKNEIKKRIRKVLKDAEVEFEVGETKMRMKRILSKEHYKWQEYKDATKMIRGYRERKVNE
jgi:hypothetical protein